VLAPSQRSFLIVALGCITLEFVTICWCFQATIFSPKFIHFFVGKFSHRVYTPHLDWLNPKFFFVVNLSLCWASAPSFEVAKTWGVSYHPEWLVIIHRASRQKRP